MLLHFKVTMLLGKLGRVVSWLLKHSNVCRAVKYCTPSKEAIFLFCTAK